MKIRNTCIDENVKYSESESISLMMDGLNCVRSWRKRIKFDPSYQVCEREFFECTAICCDCHISYVGLKSTPK